MHLPTKLCIIDTVLQSNIISYLKSRLDLLYHKHLFSLLCKYIHVLCAGPFFFQKLFFKREALCKIRHLLKWQRSVKLLYSYFIMSFSSFGRLNRLSMYLSITYTLTNIISKTLINVHTSEFFHLDILNLEFFNLFFLGGD